MSRDPNKQTADPPAFPEHVRLIGSVWTVAIYPVDNPLPVTASPFLPWDMHFDHSGPDPNFYAEDTPDPDYYVLLFYFWPPSPGDRWQCYWFDNPDGTSSIFEGPSVFSPTGPVGAYTLQPSPLDTHSDPPSFSVIPI